MENNKKNVWVTILVLIVVVLLIIFLARPRGGESTGPTAMAPENLAAMVASVSNVPASTDSVLVRVTKDGYSPKLVTVQKGGVVTFKNDSAKPVWVASVAGLAQPEYSAKGGCLGSAFDSCVGIQPGSEWSFQFNEVGTWGYQDRLNPKVVGAVEVK